MKRDPQFAHLFKTHCCACLLPMERSKFINFLITDYKQTWQFPSAGNVLSGEDYGATAILCDGCILVDNPPKQVVEFQDKKVIHHPVESLEKIRYWFWFETSPDTGHPDCLCSFCHNKIEEGEVPLRMYDPDNSDYPDGLEARLCDGCSEKYHRNKLGDLSKLPTRLYTPKKIITRKANN